MDGAVNKTPNADSAFFRANFVPPKILLQTFQVWLLAACVLLLLDYIQLGASNDSL